LITGEVGKSYVRTVFDLAGISGEKAFDFTLLYREFTLGDIVCPSFCRNLVYENNKEMLKFERLKIKIYEVVDRERCVKMG